MINLGDKNWGVKDSGLLAYKQVGSKYFNKDFDFTRASSGTYIDKNGVLQTAEVYNLISYSQDFSGYTNSNSTDEANATISPSGVQNATSFLEAATTGQHKLATSISFDGSSTYTFSIYAKTNGRDLYIDTQNSNEWGGRAWFDLTEGTANSVLGSASIQDVGNGWYRCIVTGTSTLSGGNLIELLTSNGSSNSTTGDTSKGVYIYGAQLVEGTEARDYQYTNGRVGIPRVDFSDGVGALLLEPQRTNLVTFSNSFNSWVADDVTITNEQNGVYGSNDAWLLKQNANLSRHHIRRVLSVSTGVNSFSLYAKAKELQYIQIATTQTTEEYANFDLSDGSVGNVGTRFLDAKATSVGDGWYRLSVYTNNGFNSFYISLIQSKTDGWLPSYSGDNSTDGLYIQHSQLESGSYPTSIIETTTSQVTRIADVANNCGTEQDFNSEEGVLYAEATIENTNTFKTISRLTATDTSTSDGLWIYARSDNKVQCVLRLAGVDEVALLSPLTYSGFVKLAFKYSLNNFSLWINGVEIQTDTSGNIFPVNTLSKMGFVLGTDTNPFYGKVRSVKYFPTALTDDELQNLTT